MSIEKVRSNRITAEEIREIYKMFSKVRVCFILTPDPVFTRNRTHDTSFVTFYKQEIKASLRPTHKKSLIYVFVTNNGHHIPYYLGKAAYLSRLTRKAEDDILGWWMFKKDHIKRSWCQNCGL